jgi:sporadic carbohydrate cluster 2OG-Fe(II) oxygenase/sporadic carbohydrate cluster protein (TIGR04323 family)
LNKQNQLDPRWDNQTLEYDIDKHDWPAFWLAIAREKFPQIEQLETVHEILTPDEIYELAGYCQKACDREEFQQRVDDYYGEVLPDLLDDDFMVQRFFTIRIVIPNQEKEGRLLAFHQGIWVGNGLGLRTIWTPFTKCYDTNTMWMMDWDRSDEITRQIYQEKPNYNEIQELCRSDSWPVTLSPGQAHLFQQHHIHGNYNNETNITRWSMDGRVLVKGGNYGRKLPGGYFRFLGEREDTRSIESDKQWVSYAAWNTKFGSGIPLPMQRDLINKYCAKHDIKLNDYQFENEFLDWLPGLQGYIEQPNVGGIVLCSIYNLPDDVERRQELLELAVANNTQLHFANELCSVRNLSDIDNIQRVFEFVNENTDPNVELGIDR